MIKLIWKQSKNVPKNSKNFINKNKHCPLGLAYTTCKCSNSFLFYHFINKVNHNSLLPPIRLFLSNLRAVEDNFSNKIYNDEQNVTDGIFLIIFIQVKCTAGLFLLIKKNYQSTLIEQKRMFSATSWDKKSCL